jgi:AhpD family alkylhydroperoxidase
LNTLNYFNELYGEVPEWVERMNKYKPEVLDHYTGLQKTIMEAGAVSQKDKQLLLVGINAARRYEKGVLLYTKGAVDSGATLNELVEIITPCILSRGIPAWFEGLKAINYAKKYKNNTSRKIDEENKEVGFQDVDEALQYFKQEADGVKAEWVEIMEKEASDVLLHYGNLRTSILKDGVLSRKLKEFVLIGINVAERYEKGIELHANSARKFGATDEEISEVVLIGMLAAGEPVWVEGSGLLVK